MRAVLVAVTLSVMASATQAMEPRIVFAPERALEAGEVVTVRWSGLPDDVDELEFLLQRDDGDVVRLTEQLNPSSLSFGWVVPNLPSQRAMLVLRGGIEGEELTLATSEPFAIRGAERGARLQFRNGEWWTVELPAPSRDGPRMIFVGEGRAVRMLLPTRRPPLVRTQLDIGAEQPLETLERMALIANTRCGAPRTIPQRK